MRMGFRVLMMIIPLVVAVVEARRGTDGWSAVAVYGLCMVLQVNPPWYWTPVRRWAEKRRQRTGDYTGCTWLG